MTSQKNLLLRQPIKKDGLLRQPIACYEIAKRTFDFVMTYVGNRMINKTLVMLFLVGNKNVLSKKEGNVLFNNALNTFYLRLYGVRHMVKDHSESERGNPLPPHGLLFLINSKGSFICTIPQKGMHILRPLLHQSWSTGWSEK